MSLNSSLCSNNKPNDHLPASSTGYSSATDTNELFEMSEISNCSSTKMKIDDQTSLNANISTPDMVDGCLDNSTTATSSTFISNGHPTNLPSDTVEGNTVLGEVVSHPMPNGHLDQQHHHLALSSPVRNRHLPNGHASPPLPNGHLVNCLSFSNGDIHSPNSSPDNIISSEANQLYPQSNQAHHFTNGHSNLSNGSIANSQLYETSPPPPRISLAKPSLLNGSCLIQKKEKKIPFTLLPGEQLQADEALNDGFVHLTNYRLHVEPSCETGKYLSLSNNQQPQQQLQQQEPELDSRQIISLPIGAIDSVELRDLYFLVVFTKYVQSFVLSFQTAESATIWHKRLSDANNLKVEELFCFQLFKALTQPQSSTKDGHISQLVQLNKEEVEMYSDPKEIVLKEFRRMNFDMKDWRLCELNKEFRFCSSYPQYFIVPKEMTDKELESVGNFRYSHRIPVVVWRNQKNGCVIARSSQPVVGWLGWRSSQDERLLQKILDICNRDTQECNSRSKGIEPNNGSRVSSSPLPPNGLSTIPNGDTWSREDDQLVAKCSDTEKTKFNDCNGQTVAAATPATANGHALTNGSLAANKSMEKLEEDATNKLLILDARSYAAAFANRAMGGGCECAEYYDNCDVQFMSLNNIHSIRKSFHSLRYICETSQIDQPNWFTLLDNSKWFHNLAALLKAAIVVVDTISIHERPVLVHCSDGWDRTPQVVALAQLMLDPYYRTIDGFKVLIEREWLQFGHKFTDRCRSTTLNIDLNERCPVFLQWLDCVHQLIRQFPCEFEFNVYFLIKLVYHTYSCLFGTFACNNIQERINEKLYQNTISIWAYMQLEKSNFTNYLYFQKNEILRPSHRVKDMVLWSDVYVPVSGTSVASIIPLPDCSQDVCNIRSLFVTRKNDMDSSTALNEANIDESSIEVDSSRQELRCQSQSKCDLHRSASCENVSTSKVTNIRSGQSNSSLSKSTVLQSSQPLEQENKLQMRHLSDSCLYDANDLVSNDRDSFLGSSVRTNDADCDKKLQGTNDDSSDNTLVGLEEKSRDEAAATAVLGGGNLRHFSMSSQLRSCSKQCGKTTAADVATATRCHENGGDLSGDLLATELLNMVVHSKEPTIDIDGQIVVKDKSYLQLQQLIIRYKKEIDTLTRDLKSAQKTISCLRNQSQKQSEDSNNARKHSTLNGDYNHHRNLIHSSDPAHCDSKAPNRSTFKGPSPRPAKEHLSSERPRSMTEGKANHSTE